MSERINEVQRRMLGAYERGVAVLIDQGRRGELMTPEVLMRLELIEDRAQRIARNAITGETAVTATASGVSDG
jgi:hypothetical protein